MDGVKVIIEDYPPDVDGYVVEGIDENGEPFYTICINARLNDEKQRETFYHEMIHIQKNDFDCDYVDCVDCLEEKRHEETNTLKYEFAV